MKHIRFLLIQERIAKFPTGVFPFLADPKVANNHFWPFYFPKKKSAKKGTTPVYKIDDISNLM